MDNFNGFKIIKADNFWMRFRGLMLKKRTDYGLLFENCTSIHTFFMRFNLDVIFLDKNGAVLKIKKNVKPWRIVLAVKGTVSIIEIPSK